MKPAGAFIFIDDDVHEHELFKMALKENVRGRLLRITEDLGERRNAIIIPATGLRDFLKLLDEMIEAANQLPAGKEPPSPAHE